jgi:hypothetical protein
VLENLHAYNNNEKEEHMEIKEIVDSTTWS